MLTEESGLTTPNWAINTKKVMNLKRNVSENRKRINTGEFCPGLATGKVKDSTHNPSAVSLLADWGPGAHPLSASFKEKSCFQAHVVGGSFFSQYQTGLKFMNFEPEKT